MKTIITPNDLYLDMITDQVDEHIRKRYNELGYIERNDNPNNNPYEGTGYYVISRQDQIQHPLYQKFGSTGKFYHLTSPINAEKILKKGLKSVGIKHNSSIGGPGYIWTVESSDPRVWNAIAYSQIVMGLKGAKAVVLEIDPEGITGEINGEFGADQTSPLHTVIKQDHIHSKFIKKAGEVITDRQAYYDFRMELIQVNQPEVFQQYLEQHEQTN